MKCIPGRKEKKGNREGRREKGRKEAKIREKIGRHNNNKIVECCVSIINSIHYPD